MIFDKEEKKWSAW